METLVIEVPDDLKTEVEQYRDRLREIFMLGLREIKVQEALLLYRRGVVSFARAAELAGLTREDMIRHAHAAGIQPRWSEEMVAEELA